MYYESQFMADFTLPEKLSDEFFDLLPYQDHVVNKYLANGKLLHYALSLENGKLWATFSANSEMEVREILLEFPLTRFMHLDVSMLSSYNAMHAGAAQFSLN
jgi:muconolactone delta-isomerase